MKNTTNVTTARAIPAEDRQFFFGMAAATLLSFVIAILAGEII